MRNILIDFDSTFVKIESFDRLAELSISNNQNKEAILQQIKHLTNMGMSGELSFSQSLITRFSLIKINQSHINELILELDKQITDSFLRNMDFIKNNATNIYIISSGFIDYILPVVTKFGILSKNVYANRFIFDKNFDKNGDVIDFDRDNLLAKDMGKVEMVKCLNLDTSNTYIIGDGYTDYQVRYYNYACLFFAFTENIIRNSVIEVADFVVESFDEVLKIMTNSQSLSYPKHKIKILLLENVHPIAVEMLQDEGFDVKTVTGSITEDELCSIISDVSIIGIRSKTQINHRVLSSAKRLMAIGTFCIGTNQIDIQYATKIGVCVFNAPYSNTRSVVEMVIAEIIVLFRKIIIKNNKLHQGVWDKSANACYEIRSKKIGIIGYGNIGSQLSILAENLGLDVYYYDINEKLAIGNAKKCTNINDILINCDIITIHVDGRSSNKNLIGMRELGMMKDNAILINLSRGYVVDLDALTRYLNNGKFLGVGIDVYPEEPLNNDEKFIHALCGIDRVILTPHIGGSTEEAQYNIGQFVAMKIINYINLGDTMQSINMPNMQLPLMNNAHRIIHIHQNTPGILAHMNQIFANHNINVLWQSLRTNEAIGYMITDINKNFDDNLLTELKQINHTIKCRVLY